jgi:hypothetical protein
VHTEENEEDITPRE